MPYPVSHVLFFVFCVCAVAVFAIIRSLFRRELSTRNTMQILMLLLVGTFSTLLPDIMILYNLPVNGTFEHCWVGPIATHSILFSFSALLFGTFVGYLAYRKFDKAVYMGLFAEIAFITHLLLDDIGENGCEYLYPMYNGKVSLFSLMDAGFMENGVALYLLESFLSVFFVFFVMMVVLFTLNNFGFEFKYESKK